MEKLAGQGGRRRLTPRSSNGRAPLWAAAWLRLSAHSPLIHTLLAASFWTPPTLRWIPAQCPGRSRLLLPLSRAGLRGLPSGMVSSGMARSMNWSKWGTVNAAYP